MGLGKGHLRDILVAAGVVGGILFALYLYTGNWPPPVVVESNSMMHVEASEYQGNRGDTRADGVPYGRFGTIDPGDLVLVKRLGSREQIDTFASDTGDHYGHPGDVVVYYRGDPAVVRGSQVPIIHRAMTYIDVQGTGDATRYRVQWSSDWPEPDGATCTKTPAYICTFGSEGVTIAPLGISSPRRFVQSGFITKGDNVVGNPRADQVLGIISEPVRFEWVQGVARGELPWFGLIKLMLTGGPKNLDVSDHPYYLTVGKMTAPRDVWVMLLVGVVVVALAPVGMDVGIHRLKKRYEEKRKRDKATSVPPAMQVTPSGEAKLNPVAPADEPTAPASSSNEPDRRDRPGTRTGDQVEIDLE